MEQRTVFVQSFKSYFMSTCREVFNDMSTWQKDLDDSPTMIWCLETIWHHCGYHCRVAPWPSFRSDRRKVLLYCGLCGMYHHQCLRDGGALFLPSRVSNPGVLPLMYTAKSESTDTKLVKGISFFFYHLPWTSMHRDCALTTFREIELSGRTTVELWTSE